MPRINPNKPIQKPRTADEMLAALHNFCAGKHTMTKPPDVDDDDVILSDTIAELLEARQTIEEVRGFGQKVLTRLAPKR